MRLKEPVKLRAKETLWCGAELVAGKGTEVEAVEQEERRAGTIWYGFWSNFKLVWVEARRMETVQC